MTISKEDARFWDVRTLDRRVRVRKGHVTRKDIEKHLKTLPDVTEKVAPAEETEAGNAAENE
jgi:hypothetical protein